MLFCLQTTYICMYVSMKRKYIFDNIVVIIETKENFLLLFANIKTYNFLLISEIIVRLQTPAIRHIGM